MRAGNADSRLSSGGLLQVFSLKETAKLLMVEHDTNTTEATRGKLTFQKTQSAGALMSCVSFPSEFLPLILRPVKERQGARYVIDAKINRCLCAAGILDGQVIAGFHLRRGQTISRLAPACLARILPISEGRLQFLIMRLRVCAVRLIAKLLRFIPANPDCVRRISSHTTPGFR